MQPIQHLIHQIEQSKFSELRGIEKQLGLHDTDSITIYEGTNEILELKIASMMLGRDYTAYR